MVRNPSSNSADSGMDHHYLNQGGPLQQQGDTKKRPLFLDLNKSTPKRGRFANVSNPPVLSSPDLHKLKLGSPDLEKFIMGNGGLTTATPTPNTASILFPQQPATEEQKLFVDGFTLALHEMHHSDSSQGGTQMDNMDNMDGADMRCESSSSNDSSEDYSSFLENSQGASFPGSYGVLKEEQRVPSLGGSSPPMSPINMESQEKIKLERKRQRNRLAASKCRKRKLERIAKLEDKVKLLKGENTDLSALVNRLKQQVCHLKEQVIEHVQHGCEIGSAQYGIQ